MVILQSRIFLLQFVKVGFQGSNNLSSSTLANGNRLFVLAARLQLLCLLFLFFCCLFQLLNLLCEFFDDSSREVRSFCQFLFHLLMYFQIPLEIGNLILQFLVLEQQFLGLLRLVLELARQLMILQHC